MCWYACHSQALFVAACVRQLHTTQIACCHLLQGPSSMQKALSGLQRLYSPSRSPKAGRTPGSARKSMSRMSRVSDHLRNCATSFNCHVVQKRACMVLALRDPYHFSYHLTCTDCCFAGQQHCAESSLTRWFVKGNIPTTLLALEAALQPLHNQTHPTTTCSSNVGQTAQQRS